MVPRTHAELVRSSSGRGARARDAVAGRDEADRAPDGRDGPVPRDRLAGRPAVFGVLGPRAAVGARRG